MYMYQEMRNVACSEEGLMQSLKRKHIRIVSFKGMGDSKDAGYGLSHHVQSQHTIEYKYTSSERT